MEKSALTEFETRCIQEAAAYCTAACPLHVDVKAFLGYMANHDLSRAFKILEKTLPLPDLVARICDHPCEQQCIRKDVDASIRIGLLERICVSVGTKPKKRFRLPPRAQQVGIWGSGLSSLTAAWDLSLKGYKVVIFHPEGDVGGALQSISRDVLPEAVILQAVSQLESFGVRFETAASPDEALAVPEGESPIFNAVYIGLDSQSARFAGLSTDDTGMPAVERFSLQAPDSMIFAGGFSVAGEAPGQTSYPILFAAQGRKAATSIDRFLAGVSMMAGREKEGPYQTRLSTDISRIQPAAGISLHMPLADQKAGASVLDPAAQEATRCIQCDCSRCLRVCTYLEEFKGYPGKYAREIYNNAAIVMGEHKANRLINSCSLCDLCETVCPNDFSMTDLCLSARREMVAQGKMPVSAHEFALQEMAHASGEACFFFRHAPGKKTSARIFFPGCQLLGSAPDQVGRVYDFLLEKAAGDIGMMTGCCGAPAWWAGQERLFDENMEKLSAVWLDAGQPEIVTACTACARMLEQGIPDARITPLFTLLAGIVESLPKGTGNVPFIKDLTANIIDPCTARQDDGVRRSVRTLAAAAGCTVTELPASGELTECCGFGGLVFNANPQLSGKIIRRRAGQSENDFLTYCAMCRDRLASTGKRTAHVLDLFWPGSEDPGSRPDPGFARRHDNLASAKRQFLSSFWNEAQAPRQEAPLEIRVSESVLQALEAQFILLSDVRSVLSHYEAGGDWFSNPDHDAVITFFRPHNVCFWIEFRKADSGIELLDAWCHRMQVAQSREFVPGEPEQAHEDGIRCGRCDGALQYFKNNLEYLGSRFDVVLPQCEKCGVVYISRDLARGKISEVEKILEDK